MYPLAAALIVAALAILVIVVRVVMPIKFEVTIHHKREDEPPMRDDGSEP